MSASQPDTSGAAHGQDSRNATIGSTSVARRAGTRLAARPAPSRVTAATAKAGMSNGLIPKRTPAIKRSSQPPVYRTAVPHLIGIAGGSGAGKTTLARALAAELVDAVVLSMDAYYRDLAHLDSAVRSRWNFDAPEAFDWEPFLADLRALRERQTIRRPSYDFTTHTRRPEVEEVEPRPYVIVEGLFVLYHPDVRALLDTTVFLNVDDHIALDRRVARDCRQRGRHPEHVRTQYARDVQPMFERHVRPTAQWATLSLPVGPLDVMAQQVVARIQG